MKLLALTTLVTSLAGATLFGADSASVAPATAEAKAFKNVSADEFDKLRANQANVVLDVRTPKEFAAGHIPGAVNIDWNAPDFEKKVSALDKSKTYLVHCAAGVRSRKACDLMGKIKFTNLFNLENGFAAWEKEGKPVEKVEAK